MRTIKLPWDAPPIALNDSHGNRWVDSAGRRKVREQAAKAIREAQEPAVDTYPVTFTLHWRIPDRRIRDADRLAKVAKGVLDGCVDAGLIKADDWRYVISSTCTIHPPEAGRPAEMWLSLEAA